MVTIGDGNQGMDAIDAPIDPVDRTANEVQIRMDFDYDEFNKLTIYGNYLRRLQWAFYETPGDLVVALANSEIQRVFSEFSSGEAIDELSRRAVANRLTDREPRDEPAGGEHNQPLAVPIDIYQMVESIANRIGEPTWRAFKLLARSRTNRLGLPSEVTEEGSKLYWSDERAHGTFMAARLSMSSGPLPYLQDHPDLEFTSPAQRYAPDHQDFPPFTPGDPISMMLWEGMARQAWIDGGVPIEPIM